MIELIKLIKTEISKSKQKNKYLERQFEEENGVFDHQSKENLLSLDNATDSEWKNFIKQIPVLDPIAGITDEELTAALENSGKFPNFLEYRKKIESYYKKLESEIAQDKKANFFSLFCGYGLSVDDLNYELAEYKQGQLVIPKNILSFLKFSSSTGGRFCFFGEYVDDFGIADNQVIRDLIDDELFPAFMIRFLVLGDYDGGSIGTWLYNYEVEDSEILFLDYEEQTIQIISNSMKNFTQRALRCYQESVEQNYFEPSDEVLKIIHEIDGDNVLPDSYEYSLNFTEDWPEHWQEIASDV